MNFKSTLRLLIILSTVSISSFAQDGSLDPSFGSNGKVWDPSTSYPISTQNPNTVPRILVQPDGKVLHIAPTGSVGILITRYNQNGSLDLSFGSGGKITTTESNSVYAPRNAYMLQDGKFYVIGESRVNPVGAEHGFALIRFNADGSFDNSFSGDGKAVIPLASSNPVAYGIAVQSDGKILVVGSSPGQFTTVRFNTDGSADTSFDGDGIVKSTLSEGGSETAYAVTVAPDGKILVAGQVTNFTTFPYYGWQPDLGVIRYNVNGSVDLSFGQNGDTTVKTPEIDYASGIYVMPSNGNILVTGAWKRMEDYSDGNNSGFLHMQFTSGGAYAYAGGRVQISFPTKITHAVDLVVQADEKFIIGGYTLCGSPCSNEAIVNIYTKRFWPSGTYDIHFAPGGIEYLSNSSVDVGGSLAGWGTKLITGGFARYSGQTKNFLVRLNNSQALLPRNPVTPPTTSGYTVIPAKIEAEAYTNHSGTQTENTSDVGGGQNVGYIDNGDYLDYNIHAPSTGSYVLDLRVASFMSGAKIGIYNSTGSQIGVVNVPNTGGWQNWQTVSTNLNLSQGNQTIRLLSQNASAWNINWLEFKAGGSPPPPQGYVTVPARIQAESYTNQNGTQTESTTDLGGGQNVGWIDQGDWMEYNIHAPYAGNFTFKARIATPMDGASLQLVNSNGDVWATLPLSNTGGWQNWATDSMNIMLPSGSFTIRIVSNSTANWNINWIEIGTVSTYPPPPPVYVPIPAKVQAEKYSAMSGVQLENTSDAGGGQNVGWIDNGDWMEYKISAPSAGTYLVTARVASNMAGGSFDLRNAAGTTLATFTVPNSGGWQTWVNVDRNISLPAGEQTLRIVSTNNANWNINWIEFKYGSNTPPPPPPGTYTTVPAKVEAEDYSSMSGIQTENTSDVGGGQNVGYIDYADWMEYKIRSEASTNFTIEFRTATPNDGAKFQIQITNDVAGTYALNTSISIPNSGGYQNWTSFSTPQFTLPAGNYTVRITSEADPFNINWLQFVASAVSRAPEGIEVVKTEPATELQAYPNPVRDVLILSFNNEKSGRVEVSFVNTAGVVVKTLSMNKEKGAFRTAIPMSGLKQGQYLLRINMNGVVETRKIIKM